MMIGVVNLQPLPVGPAEIGGDGGRGPRHEVSSAVQVAVGTGLVPWWYQAWRLLMPSLNVSFTDEEMERVRVLAARKGQALKPFVRDAALAADREERLRQAFAHVAERSGELYERLA